MSYDRLPLPGGELSGLDPIDLKPDELLTGYARTTHDPTELDELAYEQVQAALELGDARTAEAYARVRYLLGIAAAASEEWSIAARPYAEALANGMPEGIENIRTIGKIL